jgi:hypothetical protein
MPRYALFIVPERTPTRIHLQRVADKPTSYAAAAIILAVWHFVTWVAVRWAVGLVRA